MSPRCCALLFAGLCAAPLTACAQPPQTPWERESPLQPLPAPPLGVQADFAQLPFQLMPAKVRLGRWLFFDPRLSAGAGLSCSSCHRPEHGLAELQPVAVGVGKQKGPRKTPPLVNVAWPLYPNFFRDGRAGSLVEQAQGPITNPIEMASTPERTVAAIAAVPGYQRLHREVFGAQPLTLATLSEALAAYEATLFSGGSAFDRFDNGSTAALDARQRTGRALFFGKAGCVQCHLGWNFTDTRFHNLGIGYFDGSFKDPGRGGITGKPEDRGAFKTPTLRDVSRHPPYMHDGSLASLRDVVDFYDRGANRNPNLSPKLRPLQLTPEEAAALVAFLEALDGSGEPDFGPKLFPQ